jgi:hypothetical protein
MDSTIRIPVIAVDLLEDDLAFTTVIPEMDCLPTYPLTFASVGSSQPTAR